MNRREQNRLREEQQAAEAAARAGQQTAAHAPTPTPENPVPTTEPTTTEPVAAPEDCGICDKTPCICSELAAQADAEAKEVIARAKVVTPSTPAPSPAAVDPAQAFTAKLTFTGFYKPEGAPYAVRKTLTLDAEDNKVTVFPEKGSAVRQDFWTGEASPTNATLADLLRELKKPQPQKPTFGFFLAGVPVSGTRRSMGDHFRRTKKNFPFPAGPAMLVLDGDELAYWKFKEPADVIAAYRQIGVDADIVSESSAGAYLRWPNGSTELTGLHSALAIDKGTAIPETLERLHKHAWLHGYGRILVGEDGKLHVRSIVDMRLESSNQPIYGYGAVLLDLRITQDRRVEGHVGDRRMLRAADIPALTEAEEAQYKELVAKAKREAKPKAEHQTEVWLEKRLEGVPDEQRAARREKLLADRSKTRRNLPDDFLVTLNDGSSVSVAEIKANLDRFDRMGSCDPYEPGCGPGKATIFTTGQTDGRAKILSFAHGGDAEGRPIVYFLDEKPNDTSFDPGDWAEDDDAPVGSSSTQQLERFPDPPLRSRPCAVVLDDWTEVPGSGSDEFATPAQRMRPGLWWFYTMSSRDGPVPTEMWLSEPLHIDAQACDDAGNSSGRLLRFLTTRDTWRTWTVPMELLGGDPGALIGGLLSMGLGIDGSRDGKQKIAEYLTRSRPKRLVRCVSQIGWSGGTFVLPDLNIGPSADDVVLQTPFATQLAEMHGTGGTFEEWQTGVASMAVGNAWFVLGLSVAFAGPLLERTQNGSGGLHLVGNSSTGKTTILEAACSVWGGAQYMRTWLGTANGLEGTAAMSNHCLLALDEIGQCDPPHIGQVIYRIGNGVGKQRADRSGAARTVTRYKTVVLSTGEQTVGDRMLEGGKHVKAGQSVRLVDVNVGGRYGCFDELHGFETGKAFVAGISAAAKRHYGHAGRRFLTSLVADDRDLVARLAEIRAHPGFNLDHTDGQRERVAARFALFALAGELASEYRVTGWAPGVATEAAVKAFETWHAPRPKGNAERQQAFQAIQAFIERHGESRFSDVTKSAGQGPVTYNRAGWFQMVKVDGGDGFDEREYLFSKDGMREALTGVDFTRATAALYESGVLPPTKDDKPSTVKKIDGSSTRVYRILPRKLQSAIDGEVVDCTVVPFDPLQPFDDLPE